MSFFYSPFTDKSGDPLDIFHIQHRHLTQLQSKGIEEGYQVEFKTTLSDSVKKKIPKIVTSFANSAGGWLFIGVDEETCQIDKLQKPHRTDYNQTISQLLREHVSPLPRFESRFLAAKGSAFGVLVIYVFEGINPPYVADGTIYVRNGSSSEPVKSQRSEIDALYQKRQDFKSRIEKFCNREIYYPMDNRESNQVPLCNIYIMNTADVYSQKPHMRLDEIAEKIMALTPNQFRSYIFSSNSVIFQNSKKLGLFQIGINLEVFSDFSARIHMPIKQLDEYETECAVERLRYISGQRHVDEFLILDGYSACQSFQYIVQQYFEFLNELNIDLSAFIYKMSLEESENSILYFDSKPYESYVSAHGVPFCCKNSLATPVNHLKPRAKNDKRYDFIILLLHFFFMFGLHPEDAAQMYTEAIKANPTKNLNIPQPSN